MKFAIPALLLTSILVNVFLVLKPEPPPPPEKKCPECPAAENTTTTTTTTQYLNSSTGSTKVFGSVPSTQAPTSAEGRLCKMGEDRLRADWMRDREKNADLLRRGLASKEFQEHEMEESAARLAGNLGLTKMQTDTFTKRYREKRQARVAEAQRALEKQPPDYTALAAAVRGLYADEDALARQIAGDSALQKMQAAELEARTSLLGTAVVWAGGSMSDVSW